MANRQVSRLKEKVRFYYYYKDELKTDDPLDCHLVHRLALFYLPSYFFSCYVNTSSSSLEVEVSPSVYSRLRFTSFCGCGPRPTHRVL